MSKQETVEEAAEKACPTFNRSTPFGSKYPWIPQKERNAFIKGAKWQQERSYSEEDLKIAFNAGYDYHISQKNIHIPQLNFEEWFEQFKKKL